MMIKITNWAAYLIPDKEPILDVNAFMSEKVRSFIQSRLYRILLQVTIARGPGGSIWGTTGIRWVHMLQVEDHYIEFCFFIRSRDKLKGTSAKVKCYCMYDCCGTKISHKVSKMNYRKMKFIITLAKSVLHLRFL